VKVKLKKKRKEKKRKKERESSQAATSSIQPPVSSNLGPVRPNFFTLIFYFIILSLKIWEGERKRSRMGENVKSILSIQSFSFTSLLCEIKSPLTLDEKHLNSLFQILLIPFLLSQHPSFSSYFFFPQINFYKCQQINDINSWSLKKIKRFMSLTKIILKNVWI